MSKYYLIIAARFRIFASLILRNRISLNKRNLLYFPVLLQSTFSTFPLAVKEYFNFSRRIKNTPVPDDPVFIIGHWRTGSTFLHQLFQCDPGVTVPTLMQCTYPDCYISGRKPISLIMKRFLKQTRPMDNVRLEPDEPQEDEYALLRMTGISPLKKLLFPHSSRYFLLDNDLFCLSQKEKRKWEKAFTHFTKKLFMYTGKRIVFKNPFHSFRIKELVEIFPNARFIHIYRNPLKVIPSTKRMWSVVGSDNTLRNNWSPPSFNEVIKGFERLMKKVDDGLSALPEKCYCEVRFEDLEQNPAAVLKSIYSHFSMEYSLEFEEALKTFVKKNSKYKKNRYTLTDRQKERINDCLRSYLVKGNYI